MLTTTRIEIEYIIFTEITHKKKTKQTNKQTNKKRKKKKQT